MVYRGPVELSENEGELMRRIRLLAILFGFIALLGACSNDDPAVESPDATTEAEATDDPAAGGDIQIAASVQVAEVGDLGEVLVDENQHTIYLFKKDSGEDSACTGACATTWPAVKPAEEGGAGDGVDESKLDTNADGQAIYNGHLLYTYSGDTEAGQSNGQGVGGNWFAVSADGEAVEGSP
jgi:predicted lipoprotein with Yx(FWY)xxD motif